MSTSQLKKKHQSERRIAIIEETTRLFLENGFAGTSMSMVASACGITKATLYHHFPGKDDLFAACVTYGYSSALEALRAILEDPLLSPRTKMRQMLGALYGSIIDSPVGRMSPLIAEVSRTFPNVARSFHADYIAPQQILMSKLLDQGIAAGEFKDVDRRLFFHVVFGPIVTLSLSREMFATFDDLDEHFPVGDLRKGHIDILMDLLLVSK